MKKSKVPDLYKKITLAFFVFSLYHYISKGDEIVIDLEENKRLLQEISKKIESIGDSL